MPDMDTPRLMMPCEVCGLYEVGEHSDQVGEWCDGAGAREPTVEQVIAWLREQGAMDYEAAAKEVALDDGYDWGELSLAARESLVLRASEYFDAALSPTSQEGE